MIPYTASDHTFVVCAYKENPFLEDTIRSVKNQTVRGNVILSTSTPNDHIRGLCEKYEIPCFINPEPPSITGDWNFGYNHAETALVTMAHQDDLYEPAYLETVLKYANQCENALILFTDYYEVKLGKKEMTNTLLKIKRLMLSPLKSKVFWNSKFVRRRILSLGNPICCPAVTLSKERLGTSAFDTRYKNSCDYMTWTILSQKDGAFVYIPKTLMAHRIYAESTTTLNITENIRKKEDFEVLCHYWPKPIAKFINSIYCQSEKSNKVK